MLSCTTHNKLSMRPACRGNEISHPWSVSTDCTLISMDISTSIVAYCVPLHSHNAQRVQRGIHPTRTRMRTFPSWNCSDRLNDQCHFREIKKTRVKVSKVLQRVTLTVVLDSYDIFNQSINQFICHETQYTSHRCYCTDRNNQAKSAYGSPK